MLQDRSGCTRTAMSYAAVKFFCQAFPRRRSAWGLELKSIDVAKMFVGPSFLTAVTEALPVVRDKFVSRTLSCDCVA